MFKLFSIRAKNITEREQNKCHARDIYFALFLIDQLTQDITLNNIESEH